MKGFTPIPFYCEENIWKLLESGAIPGKRTYAVFVSNTNRSVAIFGQKNERDDSLVVWDYHVVALELAGKKSRIWDFNTMLGMPCPAETWLDVGFRADQVPEGYRSIFRLVPKAGFLRDFASDRSHMRGPEGSYLQPPPPWPCIGKGKSNLGRYIDMDDPVPGPVFAFRELKEFAAASPED